MARFLRTQPAHPQFITPDLPPPVAPFAPISVNLATGILTNQRRAQQRRTTTSDLRPPTVVLPQFIAAPVAVTLAAGLLTNQRRAQQRFPRTAVEQQWSGSAVIATGAVGLVRSSDGRTTVGVGMGDGVSVADSVATQLLTFAGGVVTSATFFLDKVGSPVDNVRAVLYADNGGSPGVRLAASTNVIAGSSLQFTPTLTKATFTFANVLVSGTVWLAVERTGALTSSGYYEVGGSTPGSYKGLIGANWTTQSSVLAATLSFLSVNQSPVLRSPMVGVSPPQVTGFTTFEGSSVNFAPGLRSRQRRTRSSLRPPAVVTTQAASFVASPVSVNSATGLLTNQRRAQQRRTMGRVNGPVVVFVAPAYVVASPSPGTFATEQSRVRRKTTSFLGEPILAAAATFFGPDVSFARSRRPRTAYRLSYPTVVSVHAAVVSTLSVNYATGLLTNWRRAQQRRTNGVIGAPLVSSASVLVEETVRVTLARTRPRATRSFLGQPQTTVATVAFYGPKVTLSRTRPRGVTARLGFPVLIASQPIPNPVDVTVVKTRPRRTFSKLPTVVVASSAFVAPPLNVNCLQPDRLAHRFRRLPSQSSLNPPTVLATFYGPQTRLERIRPRRTVSALGRPAVVRVPAVEQLEQTIAVKLVSLRAAQRRRTVRALTAVTYPATSKVAVALARIRPRRTRSFLTPPTALQTFQSARAPFVRTRPRATKSLLTAVSYPQTGSVAVKVVRTRPRHTVSALFPPSVVQTAAPVSTTVAVTLAKTRPRPTRHSLTAVTYPQTGELSVSVTRVRPRRTHAFLTAVTYPAVETKIHVALTRVRPRPTARRLYAPTVLQTFQAAKAPLVRTRPRPTRYFVAPPATLEPESVALVEREIRVTLARTRPRPTRHALTAVTYPQTSEITAAVVRSRPRRAHSFLTDVTYPAVEQTVSVALVRARPRPTVRILEQPAVLRQVAFSGPAVTAARIRPRRTHSFLTSVTYPATSEIAVTLARTRPRPTTTLLGAPTVLQTFEAAVAPFVRTRPRHTAAFFVEPATLEPESVEIAEQTIRVQLARIRPRPTVSALTYVVYPATSEISVTVVHTRPRPTVKRITPPAVLATFASGVPAIVRTRPRPTRHFLAPPTVVRVPAVEQAEQTVRVSLVHTRPRPTRRFLVPPLVKTFPPVVTTIAVTTVAVRRPTEQRRHVVEHFLRAPTVVNPLPNQRQTTISVTYVSVGDRLARRRRPTRKFLTAVYYPQTSRIAVVRVRTRPRHTISVLGEPQALQTFAGPSVTLARIRPRHTVSVVGEPVLEPFAVEQAERTIRVSLVETRPRAKAVRLTPPTVLATFSGPAVNLTRIRPRHTVARVLPPATLEPESVALLEREIRTHLVRIRPRHTVTVRVAPVTYPKTGALSAHLVRTRPRRTVSLFTGPVTYPVAVTTLRKQTVRTRPRHTLSALAPPAAVRVDTFAAAKAPLARIRPQRVHSKLSAPAVVTTPLATPITVALAPSRRPSTRVTLNAPTVVAPPPAPVVTTLAVTLAVIPNRYRRRLFRPFAPVVIGPKRKVAATGITEGYSISGSFAEGADIRLSFQEGVDVPDDATEGGDVGGASTDGYSISDATTEGNTSPT